MDFEKIRYKNKYYAIIKIKYKDLELPIVIDWQDFAIIRSLNKSWKCNKHGFISCSHIIDGELKEIFMHEIIMALKQKSEGKKKLNIPIVHINRIGLDNRRENIIYDTPDKESNKNIKKKKRIIKLPNDSGINVNDIPTYVWYMKPNDTHGERFMVDVGDVQWKTTSSRKLSLKYKLEEAKKFLRDLKKTRPELFEDYSMNGDYTKEGLELLDGYYTIIHKVGYNHINKYIPKNNTDNLLKSNISNKKEKDILKNQSFSNNTTKRRRVLNGGLPKDSGIVAAQDLPTHTYYKPAYGDRGDYFVTENQQTWKTTSSNAVSTQEKYQQLMKYLENQDIIDSSDTDSSNSFEESSEESSEELFN